MILDWNLEKLIKIHEDNYYGLLKNSFKKSYDVDKLREELRKHTR